MKVVPYLNTEIPIKTAWRWSQNGQQKPKTDPNTGIF